MIKLVTFTSFLPFCFNWSLNLIISQYLSQKCLSNVPSYLQPTSTALTQTFLVFFENYYNSCYSLFSLILFLSSVLCAWHCHLLSSWNKEVERSATSRTMQKSWEGAEKTLQPLLPLILRPPTIISNWLNRNGKPEQILDDIHVKGQPPKVHNRAELCGE